MAGILIPRKQVWTRQPQVPTRPRAIIADAISCAGVVGQDSVAKTSVTGSPARIIVAGDRISGGIATTYVDGAYHTVTLPRQASEYTIVCIAKVTHAYEEYHFLNDDDFGSRRGFQFRYSYYNIEFIPFDSSNNPVGVQLQSAPIAYAGYDKVVAIVARAKANYQKLDCTYCGSASSTALASIQLIGPDIRVGSSKAIGGAQPRGILGYTVVPRFLSDADTKLIVDNPWQIFAPQTRSIFVPTASGGAYTLTAAQGTFTETGNNAGLTAQRNISASQGSFAESGQSTGLNAQRKIAASQGSFAESGQAADLTKTGSYSLTASQGSFAESGQVAGLTAQRKIGAEPGSISLIGQAATLTKTTAGQYVLTAAGGAFAETGSAAGLAAQRNLAVSYASFALSGQTAGLLKGRSLQAAYGSFSETGQSTNLTAQRLLASSAGSIVLAGGVVTFRHIIPGEVAPIAAEFAIRPPEYRWATRPTESRWAIHQN